MGILVMIYGKKDKMWDNIHEKCENIYIKADIGEGSFLSTHHHGCLLVKSSIPLVFYQEDSSLSITIWKTSPQDATLFLYRHVGNYTCILKVFCKIT